MNSMSEYCDSDDLARFGSFRFTGGIGLSPCPKYPIPGFYREGIIARNRTERWRGRAPSEHRDGIYGRARDVLETKGGDGEQELPAFALRAGPREILEIAVVDEPETHGDQADDMEGVAERRVGQRRDVIVGVGADHGHSALAQPGAGGDVHRGRARFHRMHGTLRETPPVETRAHEKDVARFDADALRILRGLEVFGHHPLPRFEPLHAAG